MVQQRFGSSGSTGRKLNVLKEYINMYQKALSKTRLKTLYIDAFAGSGEVPLSKYTAGLLDSEGQTVLVGSAVQALETEPVFDEYFFIEKDRKCLEALNKRLSRHGNSAKTTYHLGDANDYVQRICRDTDWRFKRGVVFLDPFGNGVSWETLQAIANTKALDVWYLFPAGVGVFRQVSSKGTVHPTHEPSITRLFGTDQWKKAFLKPSLQGDLFGDETKLEKIVTAESAADFMVERMRSIFKGGVLDEKIPLGKHAYPSFYLLFAWGNSSEKANRLARKLARAALAATDRKDGRLI